MASSRQTNTMAEGCQSILQEITKMKIMPDADMNFLAQLEGTIISYLKAPSPEPMSMSGSPLGGAMQQVMQPPAAPGPGMPNPDELRRVLAQ